MYTRKLPTISRVSSRLFDSAFADGKKESKRLKTSFFM